ncbi:hypothetical protein SESBI_02712 [Sesbania bispinosa]|nr:hypothetical protein SESBI_02712 [Sesbania bispinosa]
MAPCIGRVMIWDFITWEERHLGFYHKGRTNITVQRDGDRIGRPLAMVALRELQRDNFQCAHVSGD